MKNLPSKNLCLHMAQYYGNMRNQLANIYCLEWLVCWAFYEDYFDE